MAGKFYSAESGLSLVALVRRATKKNILKILLILSKNKIQSIQYNKAQTIRLPLI